MSLESPSQIAAFSSEEEELLAYLLEEEGVEDYPQAENAQGQHAPRAILSSGQRRLWYLEQLNPQSPVYHVPLLFHLRGDLKIEALREGLRAIFLRHEILRTTIEEQEGQPWQVVHAFDELELPFQVIDLRAYAESERSRQAEELARQEASQPFDLSRPPLWRARALRLGDEEWQLLLNFHHIIFDGWSLNVLFAELAHCYQAYLRGEEAALAPLPIQYADYAIWQQRPEQQKIYDEQRDYWQKQLAGAPTVLDLPTDYPRPPLSRFTGNRLPIHIDAERVELLRSLARQEDCSLYMVILAIWTTLLYRYSNQEELIVGTTVANRSNLQTERLIGFFVNTLPLRVSTGDNPSFRELLRRVRDVALQAIEHQDLSFDQIVSLAQSARETGHMPLVQVMFSFQSARDKSLQLPGIEIDWLYRDTHTAKFDLQLDLMDNGREVSGDLEYSDELFTPERLQRMAGHLDTLFGVIASNPQQHLNELPLLTAAEEQQLLIQWNQTQVAYPEVASLHSMIEAQAERTPEAEALKFEGRSLTYRELNRQANQLAHYLREQGVTLETLVGVHLYRSLEMVIAMVAILKAGGAYVPLDPDYPAERLAFLLADTNMPLLLTTQALSGRLPAHRARAICMDTDAQAWSQTSQENPECGVTSENLAYVIYTSGSTGEPKGVMNTHRGICNRLLWGQETYRLTEQDRVLQKTPFSFDVSVWEFFWPLITGACLVVARPDGHRDPIYLARLIAEERISTAHFVPSMLYFFLEVPDLRACRNLKRVMCSGEALPYDLQRRFFQKLTNCELHNLYGPTEAAVEVTAWACSADDTSGVVPIGYPIANTDLYILDENLRPTPIGVPGELHIGGVCLARGYLNQPELTREKFICHPFSEVEGARLYKTGDLACYLPNGAIEFLGRKDYQIKLHGIRIEPGEIEAALDSHPAIRQSIVLTRQDARGQKRLVAYLLQVQGESVSAEELRAHLQQCLPSYMIPATFMMLTELPLTPSGKINRRALPEPDLSACVSPEEGSSMRPGLSTEYVAPRNEVERAIVALWEEYLEVRPTGIHDRFEELGGDSLLLLQVSSHLYNTFHVRLTVREFLAGPTVAQLATLISERLAQLSNRDLLAHLLDEMEA